MEENGARLNRSRLADAYLLSGTLRARPETKPREESLIQPRAGAVQAAVVQAVAGADGSLRAREIHQAAEKLAGTPLSWNTVKDCLHKHRSPA